MAEVADAMVTFFSEKLTFEAASIAVSSSSATQRNRTDVAPSDDFRVKVQILPIDASKRGNASHMINASFPSLSSIQFHLDQARKQVVGNIGVFRDIDDLTAKAECGNGVCEIGERPIFSESNSQEEGEIIDGQLTRILFIQACIVWQSRLCCGLPVPFASVSYRLCHPRTATCSV